MKHSVTLKEIREAPASKQHELLGALVRATKARPNGELTDVEARIHAFESRYEMSSEAMLAKLDDGTLGETLDICNWVMFIKLRGRLAERASRSS